MPDGRTVTVRGVVPTDAGEIEQAFHRLSSRSRYMRFGAHKKALDPVFLERSTHPLPGSEFAVVATAPAVDGFDIVAQANYVGDQNRPDTCEFGVTVADAWRCQGVATTLMRSLFRRAQRHGFRAIEGVILADNTPMLALARRLGFDIAPVHDDATLCLARRVLRSASSRRGEPADLRRRRDRGG
ncbi:MAG TPA: GNAT family N-acetyltransferase [Burkholderiaceae bacterium]|nr:GNAT family N-acetyltransferase [Burkholderiaceae bacterium]